MKKWVLLLTTVKFRQRQKKKSSDLPKVVHWTWSWLPVSSDVKEKNCIKAHLGNTGNLPSTTVSKTYYKPQWQRKWRDC